MVFTYEEHISKLETGNSADNIDDYFYIKSSRSNSPSNNRFEDIAFNLLSKLKKSSPNSSPKITPTSSPSSKYY
jgi:hypothetical protein